MEKLFLKTIWLSFICVSLNSCGTSYQPRELNPYVHYDDVYLIMGQSNATGVSPQSYLAEKDPEIYQRYNAGNPKVQIAYNTISQVQSSFVPTQFGCGETKEFFGPEIGMAEVLSQKEDDSYIIKASMSGSCLRTEWVTENGAKKKYYKTFISFIKSQLVLMENEGKHPRVRGVFWMQGESDSFMSNSELYFNAEQHFFNYLRHDLNNWIYDHFNFVDAYIFTRGICWVKPEIINDAKQKFCDSNEHCYCIKTNGEDDNAVMTYIKSETGEGDDLAHYDSLSMISLGKKVIEYINK